MASCIVRMVRMSEIAVSVGTMRGCKESMGFSTFPMREHIVRLSDRSGDVGKGMLEVFKPLQKKWVPACIGLWDVYTSPKEVCTLLGYSSVNSTQLSVRFSGEMVSPTNDPTNQWRITQKHRNLLKEFNNCTEDQNYRVLNITCGNYGKLLYKLLIVIFLRKYLI